MGDGNNEHREKTKKRCHKLEVLGRRLELNELFLLEFLAIVQIADARLMFYILLRDRRDWKILSPRLPESQGQLESLRVRIAASRSSTGLAGIHQATG